MDLNKQKILITGGTGFIGTNLIEELKKTNAEIINISNKGEIEGVKNISVDLTNTDFSFMDELKPDYVIHLAAFSSPRRSIDEKETLNLNYEATKKLLEKIYSLGCVKKTIFMSSVAVYKENQEDINENSPLEEKGFYAKSKILAEKSAENFLNKGLKLIIFRLSNTYGPYQQWKKEDIPTLIPQLISESILKKEMKIFDMKPVRDYIYVDDVSRAIITAIESPYSGILNLGTGKGTSVKTIADYIKKMINCTVVDLAGSTENTRIVLDITKLNKELGFTPKYDLEKGLEETIKYYKNLLEK